MRAPLSEIDPSSSGVLKVMRGDRASALSSGSAAGVVPAAPGAAGAAGAPGAVGVAEPGAAAGALGCAVVCVAVCVGGATLAGGKAYCQPPMISTESTIARMRFFWSIERLLPADEGLDRKSVV